MLTQNEKNELITQLLAERALTYTSMGEIKKAINDCNESIEIDSTNTTTYYSLAYAYLRLDDYKSRLPWKLLPKVIRKKWAAWDSNPEPTD